MNSWQSFQTTLQSSVSSLASQAQSVDASKFTNRFSTLNQQLRERTSGLGLGGADLDITELPQGERIALCSMVSSH